MTELVELDPDRRWAYLKQYYKAASEFYGARDQVVDDAEISAHINKFKEKPRPRIRKGYRLKDWRFCLDKDNKGLRDGYFSDKYDETGWELITVPHSYSYVPDNPLYFGKAADPISETPKAASAADTRMDIWRGDYTTWYKSRLDIPGVAPADCAAYISFGSVNLNSSVWVNDCPVMMDHYGLYPYEIEITEELVSGRGGKAVVAVKVDNIASNSCVMFSNGLQTAYVSEKYPQGNKAWFMHDGVYSGIAGDVTLSVRSRNHIDSAFFVTEKITDKPMKKSADMLCRVSLRNASWRKFNGAVRVDIQKWLPDICETGAATGDLLLNVQVNPMGGQTAEIRFALPEAELWDADHPNLYLAHIVLEDADGKPIDDVFESFGVRTVEARGNRLLVNGKSVTPRGSHDSSHYHGESMLYFSDEMIVKNILLHKKMGANCSRWPSDSRMHYNRLAEYCDQMGYMVSWCGFYEMWKIHPQAELYAMRDVPAVVRSLRNSPSVIFWEMGDEPYLFVHPYARTKWNELMYKLVTGEDTSRPIIPAGNWSVDLVEQIYRYGAGAAAGERLTLAQKRAKALEEIPICDAPLTVWDYHWIPNIGSNPGPIRPAVDWVTDALAGEKFTVFTEWGFDAPPDPEKVKDIYGGFKWAASPYLPWNKDQADIGYFGRPLRQDDWREAQAAQAIVNSHIVWLLRERPDKVGAFYFLCAHDWSTCYYGVFDAHRNCKLAYFAMQTAYSQVYLSGLRGSTVAKTSDVLEIMASNIGGDVSDARLDIVVRVADFRAVKETSLAIPLIRGEAVGKAAELELAGFAPGLYQIEYRLRDSGGVEIAKSLELFYLED